MTYTRHQHEDVSTQHRARMRPDKRKTLRATTYNVPSSLSGKEVGTGWGPQRWGLEGRRAVGHKSEGCSIWNNLAWSLLLLPAHPNHPDTADLRDKHQSVFCCNAPGRADRQPG